MSTLHEDQYQFVIICRSVLLGMRSFSDKNRRENQNTHFILILFFFSPPENCAVYEVMWKGRARQATDDIIILG